MTQVFSSPFRNHNHPDPGPFPMHKLQRVEHPTTSINAEEIARVDERDGGFQRAGRGEYGKQMQHEYKRFMDKYPLSHALLDMSRALSPLVDGKTYKHQAPIPDDPEIMAKHIKETAYFLRADAVGICKLPPYAVFTHSRWDGKPIKLDHNYAIAILIDQDWKTSSAYNGHDWISNSMSFLSYSSSGFIACIIADYIRKLGFRARAHHAMNYQVVVPPILLWAGLGEMCRIGDIVLHPFLGPRFKTAVVTTDLPLTVDKPIDFGLQDFCAKCKKCAKKCPGRAISDSSTTVMHNGYERWATDVRKCTSMRVGNQQGSGCGTCIKVCPWNKPYTRFHRTINWGMRHFPWMRKMGIWADDICGYGRPKPKLKWWFDLENKEGSWHKR